MEGYWILHDLRLHMVLTHFLRQSHCESVLDGENQILCLTEHQQSGLVLEIEERQIQQSYITLPERNSHNFQSR